MAIATYAICNCFGLIIEDIEYGIDDVIKFRYVIPNAEIEPTYGKLIRSKVRYEDDGRAYFMTCKRKVYLDECMRTV